MVLTKIILYVEMSIIVPKSITNKRWLWRQLDDKAYKKLRRECDLPETLCHILARRVLPFDNLEAFYNPTLKQFMPDPFHLKDMDVVVNRLIQALHNNEKIGVIGDYDVDGATSTALLTNYFEAIGGYVSFHIPDRLTEGYGPSKKAIDQFKEQGIKLMLTLDCGTVAFEELEYANAQGLEAIVLDHHKGVEKLPIALGVINPNRLDETSPLTYLAAVGVTFMTLVALNSKLREQSYFNGKTPPNLMHYLDIVALGTVCDVVPLQDLNRAFVKQGLKVMANTQNLGLKTLLEHIGNDKTPTSETCGFALGPRINAGGRVGCSKLGARLLTTKSVGEAHAIAEQLCTLNEERRDIQKRVLREALDQVDEDAPFIMVKGDDWHEGVIGVVAGRLKEKFNRPTIVIAFNNGVGKASCRSVPGVDIGALIHKAVDAEHLMQGGGHAMAGGFSIDEMKLPEFKDFLHTECTKNPLDHTIEMVVDTSLTPGGNYNQYFEMLDNLAPFSHDHPPVRVMFENVVIKYVSLMKEQHISCSFSQGGPQMKGLLFNAFETPLGDFLLSQQGKSIHLVGEIKKEYWQGQEQIKFFIADAAPTG